MALSGAVALQDGPLAAGCLDYISELIGRCAAGGFAVECNAFSFGNAGGRDS